MLDPRALEEEPDPNSTYWFGRWVSVALIALTVFYDVLGEKVLGALKRSAGEEEDEDGAIRTHAALFLTLWRRFNAELTTLGFLAFTCYVFAEAHFYEWVVGSTESLWLQNLEDEGEEPAECERVLTSEDEWLEEHVECVHMAIFISMCMYFLLVAITMSVHTRRFKRPPSTTRSELVDPAHATRRAWLLRDAAQWPAVKALAARDPAAAEALRAERLDYAGYVFCASAEVAATLVEFPPTTWLVVWLYEVFFALMMRHACAAEHAISMIIQLTSGVGWAYLGLRTLAFHVRVRTAGDDPWPCPSLDRFVVAPFGPCCSGFVPWARQPSRRLALCVQQSWMWANLYRVAYSVSNENGTLYQPVPHAAVVADIVVTLLASLFMSVVVWPYYIEVLTLPPYVTAAAAERHVVALLQQEEAAQGGGGAEQSEGKGALEAQVMEL